VQRLFADSLAPLGEREVGIIASTSRLGRDGHVIEPDGIDLSNYKRNPVVLWQHLPDCPIATTTAIGVNTSGDLAAQTAFAPEGVSPVADEICSLVKAGVVCGVSIGFNPLESTPLDRNRPNGGQHITRAELLEISFVSIPADTGAGVVARTASRTLFRSLPTIPRAYVQRAAAAVPRARGAGARPFGHTMQTWLLYEQNRRAEEAQYSYEARQAVMRRLRREAEAID
jgi:HK97 family phage prohead protease